MPTITSRPERNTLTPAQQELVDREAAMIAKELRLWLPDAERLAIKRSKKPIEVSFYTELTRAVRNEYDLWLEDHHITKIWLEAEKKFPLPEDGPTSLQMPTDDGRVVVISSNMPIVIDDHPCHPDNFSATCIRRLWEILQ